MPPPQNTPKPRLTARQTVYEVWRFTLRVLANFQKNKGILMSGGVAYNMLLSIVPLLAVFLSMATLLVDKEEAQTIINTVLEHTMPTQADVFARDIEAFLAHPELLGGVGLIIVLFFSSLAFRMLQDAMAVIFARPRLRKKNRSFWVSAFLPYAYLGVAVIVLLALTVVVVTLGLFSGGDVEVFGINIGDLPTIALYLGGFTGEVLLFASIYRVMPVTHVHFKRALIGGLWAAILWETLRRMIVYWFTSISLVSVVYGSLTTVIIMILVLEIAAIILLLGGQIIAELQHSEEAGLEWYEVAGERTGQTGSHQSVGGASAEESAAAPAPVGADMAASEG